MGPESPAPARGNRSQSIEAVQRIGSRQLLRLVKLLMLVARIGLSTPPMSMRTAAGPSMPKRCPSWLALVLVLATGLGCASSPEPQAGEPGAEIDSLARGRQEIGEYLEATRPLDADNSLLVYDVAQRGPELVPALVAKLDESRDDEASCHLIRLGCTMIRSGSIDEPEHPQLRPAMENALSRMWYGSSEARLARARLRECDNPTP